MLTTLRLVTTVLTILWPFIAYRFTRARLLEKKRLIGLGERPNNQWLYSTQSFVLAITIASLIQSFYMPFRVASDRMSPHLDKGSLVIVERFNRHFIKGDIISYKEGKKDFLGLVAKTRAVNDSSKNLLITDYRGKEVNVLDSEGLWPSEVWQQPSQSQPAPSKPRKPSPSSITIKVSPKRRWKSSAKTMSKASTSPTPTLNEEGPSAPCPKEEPQEP